ncbi:MAG TPA: FecR domain-containing protein [Steroidobacteraceae bacterium]|nr:FecR domain-containing protein [Steroidobacteraceae bacterium]
MNVQIYKEATQWLVKHRGADLDAREKWEFDAWLRASPQHVRAYLEMSAVWEEVPALDPGWNPPAELLIARARSEDNVLSLDDAVQITKGEPRLRSPFRDPQGAERLEPPDSLEHPIAASDEEGPNDESRLSPMTAEAATALVAPPRKGCVRSEIHRPGAAAYELLLGTRKRPLALVAMLLTALVGITIWHQFSGDTYATAIGEQRTVALADGSTVELDSHSRVRIRYTESRRDVDLLEGQALFQVAHNAARPFIVHSGITSVRDVGTQFDVYRKPTGTVVTVVEGRVSVRASTLRLRSGTQSAGIVNPSNAPQPAPAPYAPRSGGNAIFVETGEQLTVPTVESSRTWSSAEADILKRVNVAAATAWTRHELVFDSSSLADVVEEFNRYNAHQIVITDPGLASVRITGIFSSVDPSLLLKFLRTQPGISIEETGTEIRIGRRR